MAHCGVRDRRPRLRCVRRQRLGINPLAGGGTAVAKPVSGPSRDLGGRFRALSLLSPLPGNAASSSGPMKPRPTAPHPLLTSVTWCPLGPIDDRPTQPTRAQSARPNEDCWAPSLIAWATRMRYRSGVEIVGEEGATTITTPSGDTAYVSGVLYLELGSS